MWERKEKDLDPRVDYFSHIIKDFQCGTFREVKMFVWDKVEWRQVIALKKNRLKTVCVYSIMMILFCLFIYFIVNGLK